MSSLNSYPTFHYSQPEEYRFSHDSVFLAREIFEIEKEQAHSFFGLRALDLCSGCGIVGLDWLFHIQQARLSLPECLDFIELQTVYTSYFEANLKTLISLFPQTAQTEISNHWQNYTDFRPQKGYDLIFCNPPYFRQGQGALSDSDFKNRCRFFLDADFNSLLSCLQRSLATGGRAYVLIPDLSQHGLNVQNEISLFCKNSNWNVHIDQSRKIRKTNLFIFKN